MEYLFLDYTTHALLNQYKFNAMSEVIRNRVFENF